MSFIIGLILLIFSGLALLFLRRRREIRWELERKILDLEDRIGKLSSQLQEERSRLDTTFSGMVEGVLLTDRSRKILHVNPALRDLFGLPKDLEGRSVLEVLTNVACHDALREVRRTGKPLELEIAFDFPKKRIFQIRISPMRRGGEVVGAVSLFHDLTEFRKLEEVRRDFVANLSHEIKTPLTAIQGYSETLLESTEGQSEPVKKNLEVIFRNASDLGRLVENLLNLSRIESGKEELATESVALKPFAEHLFERFAVQAQIKRILLKAEISESFSLNADSAKLNQILSNLLDNSIKYTPDGGTVTVRASQTGKECRIEVCDNGPGIPVDDQQRIFERFYRVDKARARGTGGAGLGLAIVKHLVELHRGVISVESTPGGGSTFVLTFPQ